MPKRKTYYYMAIFFIVFLSIASINVRGHPPSNMTLEFDSNTNALTVTITHDVSNNLSHYIQSVVISVNGTMAQTHDSYTSQPDLLLFVYEYTVITDAESTINVRATCSEGGSISRTLGGTSGGGIPGYMGLYLVLIVSVITMLILLRRKLEKG